MKDFGYSSCTECACVAGLSHVNWCSVLCCAVLCCAVVWCVLCCGVGCALCCGGVWSGVVECGAVLCI